MKSRRPRATGSRSSRTARGEKRAHILGPGLRGARVGVVRPTGNDQPLRGEDDTARSAPTERGAKGVRGPATRGTTRPTGGATRNRIPTVATAAQPAALAAPAAGQTAATALPRCRPKPQSRSSGSIGRTAKSNQEEPVSVRHRSIGVHAKPRSALLSGSLNRIPECYPVFANPSAPPSRPRLAAAARQSTPLSPSAPAPRRAYESARSETVCGREREPPP